MRITAAHVLLFSLALHRAFAAGDDLKLTLPPVVYATPDVEMAIYFDNIVLTEKPESYRFEFASDLGKAEERRWVVKPADKDVGDHPIEVRVKDSGGRIMAEGKTTLHVATRGAGAGKALRLLIVGDSLTHASTYPNEIATLLSRPGNPTWVMFGTHHPAGALPKVNHEGYGGWRWIDFLTKFAPQDPSVTAGPLARKATSPFVFPAADGKTGSFDLQRYFRENCGNQPPDVVTFLLGINDCFAADPNNPDAKINEVLDNADKLLAAFHQAAPKALLAVGLTPPPNARQEGFTANYKDKYPRWGWKRIQHRLVQRMLERLSHREKESIFVVPTELNLDPVNGFPNNNGVHPNTTGYQQIGASFYSWLKANL